MSDKLKIDELETLRFEKQDYVRLADAQDVAERLQSEVDRLTIMVNEVVVEKWTIANNVKAAFPGDHDSDCALHNVGTPELFGVCNCRLSTTPRVPEGWALVPTKPTKKMMKAGDNFNCTYPSAPLDLCYKAMLEAPSPVQEADSNGHKD